jgi:hypothetical protein
MMAPMIEAMTEKVHGAGRSMADNGALQEDLGRYIVANSRMPNVPGNEPGQWDFLPDIPTGNQWSAF